MRYLVSGDIHIKVSKELPLEWQLNRFRMLFKTYVDMCRKLNAELILVGDTFHNPRPNLHEIMLFTELCSALENNEIPTTIIAGNHENMGADGTTLDYLNSMIYGMTFVHYPTYIDPQWDDGVEVIFVGHDKLQEWLEDPVPKTANTRVVFTHFRPTVNQFITEEIDVAKMLDSADLVIAGDIHSDFEIDNKLIYTNMPLNNHFEPAPNCGCLLVTLDDGSVTWKRIKLELPNLIQVNTTADKYADIHDDYNFYRVEVTGTPEELRKVKSQSRSVKLLKVPDVVETYAELEATAEVQDQSLDDALIAYMQELEYSEERIKRMMEVLHG